MSIYQFKRKQCKHFTKRQLPWVLSQCKLQHYNDSLALHYTQREAILNHLSISVPHHLATWLWLYIKNCFPHYQIQLMGWKQKLTPVCFHIALMRLCNPIASESMASDKRWHYSRPLSSHSSFGKLDFHHNSHIVLMGSYWHSKQFKQMSYDESSVKWYGILAGEALQVEVQNGTITPHGSLYKTADWWGHSSYS